MKAYTTLIMVGIVFAASIFVFSAGGVGEPSVGVKKGDWIEYAVNITAPTPSVRNITWYRVEILDVEGVAFDANFTVKYYNGTVTSKIWKFNFTEGQLEGWIIIPANLSVGDTFYDMTKPGNVTIQGEEQKNVAGAMRTVTHASDEKRLVKEWDKATGVYVYALERPKNFTIITTAVATNMWTPQNQEHDQASGYLAISAGILLVAVAASLVIVTFKRKNLKKTAMPHRSQTKIAALTIALTVLAEVAIILFFPFNLVRITFAQFNLVAQTFWTALVLASMWFRIKGNYFAHFILMLIVMCAWIVGFTAVMFMDPLSSNPVLANTPLRLIMNSLHAIFSVPALALGLWLVTRWRPESQTFPAKTKRTAQLLAATWVPSYVVGVLDFIVLHTTWLG